MRVIHETFCFHFAACKTILTFWLLQLKKTWFHKIMGRNLTCWIYFFSHESIQLNNLLRATVWYEDLKCAVIRTRCFLHFHLDGGLDLREEGFHSGQPKVLRKSHPNFTYDPAWTAINSVTETYSVIVFELFHHIGDPLERLVVLPQNRHFLEDLRYGICRD